MIETTLYIDGVKVDMFEGANLTLNDSIKKTTDVANVSTSFTRDFKLPASKTNNKVFQHYYNTLIRNGFDSRRKHDALIKLNGADFRKGYIKLNGVELENNKAKSYNVQFFGELSSLKDRMGEDMLEDLTYLARYNHDYNQATVKSAFEQSLKSTGGGLIVDPNGELIYPFISHTRGFKFDSNGLYDVTQGGTPTSADRLSYDDLKPAIKVNEILSAMEYKYDLSFTGDFRDGAMFQELFMWLHREKGFVRNGSEVDNNNFVGAITPDGVANPVEQEYALDSGDEQRPLQTYGQVGGQLGKNYKCTFEVQTADAGSYQMVVIAVPTFTNGEPQVYVLDNQSGNSDPLEFDLFSYGVGLDIEFWEVWTYVYAENTISTLTPIVTVNEYFGDTLTDTGVYGNSAEGIVKYLDVPVNMPKMRCIDFVRGLMRLFNLVAYDVPKGDTDAGYDIVLEPLDDFYDNGVPVDLTKYVDISSASVQRVEPFNLIEFEYPDPVTLFAKKSNEVQRINFGNAKFDSSALAQGDTSLLYDGGAYSVEVGFEKAQYERIENGTTSLPTQLQWGWFVNDFEENEPEPEIGEPLLFFRNVRECDVDEIEWVDTTTTNTTYNAPSNVSTDQLNTLNFDAEIDEFTLTTNENGLFNKFYKRFIEGIYDIDARRYKVDLYLPPKYLFEYRLNDKVFLNYTPFNIENISINTKNGKTSLELLKITARDEVYDVEPGCIVDPEYPVGANVTSAWAFSLRRWYDWPDAFIQVRRSSDNATTDVYFDTNQTLLSLDNLTGTVGVGPTSTTLGDWAGSDDVHVRRWYMQKSDGILDSTRYLYDTNNNIANEARILDSGALILDSATLLPIAEFTGTSKYRPNGGTWGRLGGSNSCTIVVVSANRTVNSRQIPLSTDNQAQTINRDRINIQMDNRVSNKRMFLMRVDNVSYLIDQDNFNTDTDLQYMTMTKDSSQIRGWLNGTEQGSALAWAGSFEPAPLMVLGWDNNSFFTGDFFETFTTSQDEDAQGNMERLHKDLNCYFK